MCKQGLSLKCRGGGLDHFGNSDKLLAPKLLGLKKNLVWKKFESGKKLSLKKCLVKKKYWVRKNFGSKKFWA